MAKMRGVQDMDLAKSSIENLTKEQFAQIVEMEANSGLEPYTPEMLLECMWTNLLLYWMNSDTPM